MNWPQRLQRRMGWANLGQPMHWWDFALVGVQLLGILFIAGWLVWTLR